MTTDQFSTDLGMRIRSRREKLKLTQAQLGEAADVSKSAVSQWESGVIKDLRLQTFYKVVEKLRVRGRYLVFGELPEEPPDRDLLPEDAVSLAKRIAALPEEKQKLLLDIFGTPADDSRLSSAWRKPE